MEILQKAQDLTTKEELLDLLNEIKASVIGKRAKPIDLKYLTRYCDPRRPNIERYKNFSIPKKSRGVRTISAPVARLKDILTYLNILLSSMYKPSEYAKGFVKGQSVATNALAHVGHNYVFNLDLKDFFPSIEKSRIWKRLTLPPFNFQSNIADIIAGLCTMRVEAGETAKYVLPQGAPTSPIITNMICQNLDRKLAGLARRFGLIYTRYADDITFSSMHNVYAAEGEFMAELKRIIAEQNFTINEAKTRLQNTRCRREVTGLTISHKINVPKKYVNDLRQLFYIWEKYGISVATTRFMAHYSAEKPHEKKTPSIQAYIEGKLLYLKMVKGEKDSVYIRLHDKFVALTGKTKEKSFADNDLAFTESCSCADFEKKMQGHIEISRTEKGAIKICLKKEDGETVPIAYSENLKEVLSQHIGSSAAGLSKIEISLCNDGAHGFFLLHKSLPKVINNAKSVDQQLNDTLEKLVQSDFDLGQVFGGQTANSEDLAEIFEDDHDIPFDEFLDDLEN